MVGMTGTPAHDLFLGSKMMQSYAIAVAKNKFVVFQVCCREALWINFDHLGFLYAGLTLHCYS